MVTDSISFLDDGTLRGPVYHFKRSCFFKKVQYYFKVLMAMINDSGGKNIYIDDVMM